MMDLFPIAARSAANALSNEAYQKLLTSEAETLLSSAGIDDTERFWTDSPVEPIEAIMEAVGLR